LHAAAQLTVLRKKKCNNNFFFRKVTFFFFFAFSDDSVDGSKDIFVGGYIYAVKARWRWFLLSFRFRLMISKV
jgi:hypothetical protein